MHHNGAESMNMSHQKINPVALIQNINTAVLVFDEGLRLLSINAAGENLLSVSSNKVVGLRPDQFLPGSGQFSDSLKKSLVDLRPYIDWGVSLNLYAHRTITVGCMVTPVFEDENCRQLIVELIDSDSFTRVMREESITAVYDTARKSLKGIAHEIKNPLGGLRGAAQLLERELDNNELKEYTRIIIQEADRLRKLVDRMLLHDTRPQLGETNLHELLEYVVDLVQAEAESRLDIARDYDPSLPLLQADREQLIQVFINVIRNAMQAIAGNGKIVLRTRIKRRFTIRQQFHKLVAQIDVIDNGPGIPEDIQDDVFYPLITGRAEGTGLGLSIAQSLLQLHGGSISYEREHELTVLRILIPLSQ